MFSFAEALEMLEEGGHLRREGWNGKGMHVAVQNPDHRSKMTLPYAYMCTPQGTMVPWTPSQADMFSQDWQLVG